MSRKKILVIQFRTSKPAITSEQKSITREVGGGVEVTYLSALDTSLAWDNPASFLAGYSGLILGGSGEFYFDGNLADDDVLKEISKVLLKRVQSLLDFVFDNDFPTLGICYGHQLLGAHNGVPVMYNEQQKKTGTFTIDLTKAGTEDHLFQALPASFKAIYGHKDILAEVPANGALLAYGGEMCTASALRYLKNIYTVQFHPELSNYDMEERLAASPGYLPEGVSVEETFTATPEANTLIGHFVTKVVS